jgi:hypothetical protein
VQKCYIGVKSSNALMTVDMTDGEDVVEGEVVDETSVGPIV